MNKRTEKLLRYMYAIVVGVLLIFLLLLFAVFPNSKYIFVTFIFLIVSTILTNQCRLKKTCKLFIPIAIFLLSFGIRLIYCYLMERYITQVSDFEMVLSNAISGEFLDDLDELRYYRIWSHKFIYPWLLNTIGVNTQMDIFLFQGVIAAVVSLSLYYLGKEIGGEKYGIIASVIHIVWPSQIIYTIIVTEEHMAALITVLIVYLFIKLEKEISNNEWQVVDRKKIIKLFVMILAEGVMCGFCAFFKDWALIIMVAVVICSIYLFVRYDIYKRIILLGSIVVIMLCQVGIKNICTGFIDEKLGGMETNNNVIIWQMFESLDPNGTGLWNPVAYEEYIQLLIDSNYNYEIANKEAMEILLTRISQDVDKMPKLLLKKGISSYQNDSDIFRWVILSIGENFEKCTLMKDATKLLFEFSNVFYMLIILCIIISAITVKDKRVWFILLIILGAILSGLLIECQGRYKYSIEPIFSIMFANATYVLPHFCKAILKLAINGRGLIR